MRNALGWAVLLSIALILIICGITGRIGSVLGALITPAQLEDVQTS